ncbi:MAG: hypothetical protein V1918_01100, partial [Planctomycetota bacterium]
MAMQGRPVLNVRIHTFRSLALALASPLMDERGLSFLRGGHEAIFMAGIFYAGRQDRGSYLSQLPLNNQVVQALTRSIRDLRLAGIGSGDLAPKSFELNEKGRDIRNLLSTYEMELQKKHLADYAEVLRLAMERRENSSDAVPQGLLLLSSEELYNTLANLEKQLWDALPEAARRVIPVDRPGNEPARDCTDAGLLSWIASPHDAPAPKGDGTARIFHAVGAVNEVREVLRRCMAEGIPFDTVEILHTDADTYVPLIYKEVLRLTGEECDDPPVTFSEGLPARFFRPGRALRAWLAWVEAGFPQRPLARMLRDGLLKIPSLEAEEEAADGHAGLAAVLSALPIGAGRERYAALLDREIAVLAGSGEVLPGSEE